MKSKQFHSWTCASAVALAAFAFAVATANAQVGVPTHQKPADRPEHQGQYHQGQDATMNRTMSHDKACKASDVIGLNVRAKSGDESIGEIKDLMISHDGNVEYVAVSFGGFLGMGDKLFAVPLEAIEFEKPGGDPSDAFARIDVTEETLRDKKGFNEDNWPEEADQGFLTGSAQRQAERSATHPQ